MPALPRGEDASGLLRVRVWVLLFAVASAACTTKTQPRARTSIDCVAVREIALGPPIKPGSKVNFPDSDADLGTCADQVDPTWNNAARSVPSWTLHPSYQADSSYLRRDESDPEGRIYQRVVVSRGGVELWSTIENRTARTIVQFGEWNGRWVLETADERVIIDGGDLRKALRAERVLAWNLIAGVPVFVLERGGAFGIHVNDHDLAARYDEVFFGQCCEYAAYNSASEELTHFFARRGPRWYSVTITRR